MACPISLNQQERLTYLIFIYLLSNLGIFAAESFAYLPNNDEDATMAISIDNPPPDITQNQIEDGWDEYSFFDVGKEDPKSSTAGGKLDSGALAEQSTIIKTKISNSQKTTAPMIQETSFLSPIVASVQQLMFGKSTARHVPQEIFVSTGVGDDELTYLFSGDKNDDADELQTLAGEYFPNIETQIKAKNDVVEFIPDFTHDEYDGKLRNRRRLNTTTAYMSGVEK